jgi:hypothetical protein
MRRLILIKEMTEYHSPCCLQVEVFHSKDDMIGSLENDISQRITEGFAEARRGDAQSSVSERSRHDLHICVVHGGDLVVV